MSSLTDLHNKTWVSLQRQFDNIIKLIEFKYSSKRESRKHGRKEILDDFEQSFVGLMLIGSTEAELGRCLEFLRENLQSKNVHILREEFYRLGGLCDTLEIDIWHYYNAAETCIDVLEIDEKESDLLYIVEQNSIVIPKLVIEVHSDLIKRIAQNPDLIFQISPRRFEEIIAEIFYKKGFHVELTKATRDGGRDIIALYEYMNIRTKYLIECKRYAKTNKVSIGFVQRLLGVKIAERANKAILATTSTFTRDARFFASNNLWDLDLKDYDDIVAWIKSY